MFGIVDVRDVADMHLRAMTHPDANGERFLAVAGDFMSIQELDAALKRGSADGDGGKPDAVGAVKGFSRIRW